MDDGNSDKIQIEQKLCVIKKYLDLMIIKIA